MSDSPDRPRSSLFNQFRNLSSPYNLEDRGKNAVAAGAKFLSLLQSEVDDPEEVKKIFKAWVKSVAEKDPKRFLRVLRRYRETKGETPDDEKSSI